MRDRRPFGGRWTDLAGDGLVLRPWREDDVDALVEGSADPETARFVPVPVPFTAENGRYAVRTLYPRQWAEGAAASLAVEEDGQVVGYAVLIRRDDAPEVGWWTSPSARGRGVARRAAALLTAWAHALGHPRVVARVDVENPASLRAAEAAGFVREGVLRSVVRDRDGRPRDMVLLAHLQPEGPPAVR